MVEVELSKIIIDEKKQEQMIVLREKSGSRALPIILARTRLWLYVCIWEVLRRPALSRMICLRR